jgi:hypothetical protein
MSRAELKSKVRENACAWTIIALLSSGGGSAVTSLRGPSSDEIDALQDDVHAIKIQVAQINQKLEDFIDHSRELRKTAMAKK